MTTIKATGRLLKASADTRTLSYLLLPFGEEGSTSAGKVTASAGTLDLPESITANLEHDRTRPVARSTSIAETDAGLTASFRIAATQAGNDLLIEAAEGLRTGISVEIDDPVIRDGALLGGRLTGAGFVTQPAFPSAQLTASDVGDDPEDEDPDEDEDLDAEDPDEDPDAAEDPSTEDPDDEDKDTPVTARLSKPATRPNPLKASRPATTTKPRTDPTAVYQMLASAANGGDLTAALTQISNANAFDVANVPQYLGEVWSGVAYEQEFAPLLAHADLTSPEIIGWRFKEAKTPVVGDWTGGGTQVPTNAVELENVNAKAKRLAAGWAIDRQYRDFPSPEFWAAFHRLSAESYAKQIDLKVRDYLVLAANAVKVTYAADSIPAGVNEASAKIVKGALALKAAQKGKATFAVLGLDLYEQWLYTRQEDALVHLAAQVGLDGASMLNIQVVGTDQVPLGTTRVGVRQTATLHELGGASPLRVSTEDIAVGNMTEAMFGYYGIFQHDKKAIVDVSVAV